MKKSLMRSTVLTLGFLFLLGFSAKAQDFDDIFRAGTPDANTYLQKFIEPAMFSFNSGLASGWNNTAKPHKLFGFDITASVNVANIPDEDKVFDFTELTFQNLVLTAGDGQLPTIVGGPTDGELAAKANTIIEGPEGTIVYELQSPDFPAADGIDVEDFPLAGLPVPTVQLGVGVMKNTDLKIRYVPTINEQGLTFKLFGIGVLHDIKQWIPGLKPVPIDISGFVGHTGLSAEYVIDETLGGGEFEADATATFKASATTFQVLASKKIAILTPYVGVGYNIARSSFKVDGDFRYLNSSPDPGEPTQITLTDPVDLEFNDGNSPRLTAGLRLKLLVLTIHADYTIQKYNTLSAGVGINVR